MEWLLQLLLFLYIGVVGNENLLCNNHKCILIKQCTIRIQIHISRWPMAHQWTACGPDIKNDTSNVACMYVTVTYKRLQRWQQEMMGLMRITATFISSGLKFWPNVGFNNLLRNPCIFCSTSMFGKSSIGNLC